MMWSTPTCRSALRPQLAAASEMSSVRGLGDGYSAFCPRSQNHEKPAFA
jgi:hypothetical protein